MRRSARVALLGMALALPISSACSPDEKFDVTTPCSNRPTSPFVVSRDLLQASCVGGNDEVSSYTVSSLECDDGRTLLWSEVGWGYDGGELHVRDTDLWVTRPGPFEPPRAELDACSPGAEPPPPSGPGTSRPDLPMPSS